MFDRPFFAEIERELCVMRIWMGVKNGSLRANQRPYWRCARTAL
jgi:hypothetical protein